MNAQKLRIYVKECKKKKISKSEMVDSLKESKYDEKSIKLAISYYNGSIKKLFLIIPLILIIIVLVLLIPKPNINLLPKTFMNNNNTIDEKSSITESKNQFANIIEAEYIEECEGFCCIDADCDDNDPLTKNICSGVPKMCYEIIIEEIEKCSDCFGGFSGGGSGDGGGGDSGGGDASTGPIIQTNPDIDYCLSDNDCLSPEICSNGVCSSETCIDLGGSNCDLDQTCDGEKISSIDNPRCCIGECILAPLICSVSPGEIASMQCDGGCISCGCGLDYLSRSFDWNGWICLYQPDASLYLWTINQFPICEEGINSQTCKCGTSLCGYDIWMNCNNGICQQ